MPNQEDSNENMLKKFEFIVNTSKEFMTMINRDYEYVAANRAYCNAHNRTHKEIIGKTISEIWGVVKGKIIKDHIKDCFTGKEVSFESWFDFPALGMRCFEVNCYPFNENGTTTHMVVISRDITERKNIEKGVFIDALTNLFNHRYVSQRLEEEFERAKRYKLSLPVLLIDIDNFKNVNDNLGHNTGNDILIHLAGILNNTDNKSSLPKTKLRKVDIVARYGGEEFIIILPETGKKNAINISERIRKTVENYNFLH